MLKILLSGDEFNKAKEERQPPFSEFTGRHNTSADAAVLPVGRKVIHLPVIRRAKPTSDRADSERNQMVKYCGPFLAGDLCGKTQLPASYEAALQKQRIKDWDILGKKFAGLLQREGRCSESAQKCNRLFYSSVKPSMCIHARLNCCAAITNVLCALQTCLRFAHLSMWSDHHSSTAEPFWLLMEEAFLAWSRCEIIPPNIFAMVSQTQLYCLSFPTGQEHSRGQSSQCSWHMRILILKNEQ